MLRYEAPFMVVELSLKRPLMQEHRTPNQIGKWFVSPDAALTDPELGSEILGRRFNQSTNLRDKIYGAGERSSAIGP